MSYKKAQGLMFVLQITTLKAQEREFADARSNSMHHITDIRSQLKQMLRMDEKISEAENKIYSLRSELARVCKTSMASFEITFG